MNVSSTKIRRSLLKSSSASYRNIKTYSRNRILHLLKFYISLNTQKSKQNALEIVCDILKKISNESRFSLDLYRVIISLFYKAGCDAEVEYLKFLRLVAETTTELRYFALFDIANYHLRRKDYVKLAKDVSKHFIEWKLEDHEDAILLYYMTKYIYLTEFEKSSAVPQDVRTGIRRVFKIYYKYKRIPSSQSLDMFVATNYAKDPSKCMELIDMFIELFPTFPHLRLSKYNLLEPSDKAVEEAKEILFNCYAPSERNFKAVIEKIDDFNSKIDISSEFLLRNPKSNYVWGYLSALITGNVEPSIANKSISKLSGYYDPEMNIARSIDKECIVDYLIVGIVASPAINKLFDLMSKVQFIPNDILDNNSIALSKLSNIYTRVYETELPLKFYRKPA